MIRKMKAAILVRSNEPLVIDEVGLPEAVGIGQVLVKVLSSGICGSQLGEIAAVKGPDKFLPHLLGHEGCGVVLETGPGVNHVAEGDRVVLHWKAGLGLQTEPPAYTWQGKRLNAGFVTTFNEYAVVSENRLTRVDPDLDPGIAALFGCAVTTGLGVASNNAKIQIGESVVVFGAGGVGLNVIQGAALSSAYPIVAVDILDNKLEMAAKFGATHCLNSMECDPVGEIKALVGEEGADVVIDNTGDQEVVAAGYELTQPQGRLILVGVPKAGHNSSLYTLPLFFGKSISGSWGGESRPAEDIPRYLRLYRSGRLKLDELITHRFTLDEINTALDMMRGGEIEGRCLLEINDP